MSQLLYWRGLTWIGKYIHCKVFDCDDDDDNDDDDIFYVFLVETFFIRDTHSLCDGAICSVCTVLCYYNDIV